MTFEIGSKIKATRRLMRTDGLVEHSVFIAEITSNNGFRCEYKVLQYILEENMLGHVESGGFVIRLVKTAGIEPI